MGKKITSFLVLLAAVLLSLPTHAQVSNAEPYATRKKAGVEISTRNKFLKQQQSATNANTEAAKAKADEKRISPEEEQYLIDKAAKEAAASQQLPIVNWAKLPQQHFVPQNNLPLNSNVNGNFNASHKTQEFFGRAFKGNSTGAKKGRRAATTDSHGIITVPDEGEHKFYTRTGTAYYLYNQSAYTEEQTGHVEIVETTDGTVYIKDIVTDWTEGSWVKGTKDGNTITVAAGQPVSYSESYATTLSVNWGNGSSTSGYTRQSTENITFTIDGNTISLNGSSASDIIGIFWDDDNSWQGFGDYNTAWTLDNEYEAPSTELVQLPSGATIENWYAEGTGSEAVPSDPKVAFVGNDVYVSGIFAAFPNAWIKGTISGTTATFESGQYLGKDNGSDAWAIGSNGSVVNDNFTFTYDATAKTLTLDASQYLIANTSVERVSYIAYIGSLTLYAEKPAPTQIDDLPYTNDFSTSDLQKHFTVIDANGDGTSWIAASGYMGINFADENDDWLVSPAIKLVAGKKYHFAIDSWVRGNSYPETFEVKAATEATAEALAAGTTVIAQQTIKNTAAQTFENEEFTVSETGYYYIGIHNTSLDQWAQYVDNFLIEAAPITAPYTADFTSNAPISDFSILDNNNDGKTWNWSASNYAYYTWSDDIDADDYLILPIKLEAGKNYRVAVEAAAASSTWSEKFEVVAGKGATADALSTTVIAEQTLKSSTFTEFEGTYSPDEAGTYYIAIHATSPAGAWYLKVKTFTVEVGAESNAPAKVDNFTVTPLSEVLGATINFNAPTKALDGTDLAAGDITKIEILRDGNVINTVDNPAPGAETSFVDQSSDLTVGNHKYQVIPYGASGVGEKSEEITVFLTEILTVPYTADFSVAGTFDTFQVLDNNSDDRTWAWSASYGAYYSYSSANAADDYLITSPIRLEAGKSYNVTVSAKTNGYTEKFEVVVGKEATAAGLSQTVISETTITTEEYEDTEGEFSVTEDGIYYVAIHATSAANQWRLHVAKLSIEKGAEPTAPAAPVLSAVPGDEGALEVNLSFTAPDKAIDGTSLSGTEDIKIYRDDVLVNTLTGVAPGSAQTWKDTSVEDGKTYTYYVVASNASGDGQKSEKVSVYVGQDEIDNVKNFAVTATTPTTVSFSWDEVTGKNGGYVNKAAAVYTIYGLNVVNNQYLEKDETLGTFTAQTSGTVNYPVDEGESNYKYFGISVKTTADNETSATASYTYLIVGAPEELPILEGFAGSTFHYNWNTNGGAYVSNNASDGDGVALLVTADDDNTTVYFQLDKVNLATAANPTLFFDVLSPTISSVNVIGAKDGEAKSTLQTESVSNSYKTVKVDLSGIKSGRSTVGFEAFFEHYSYYNQFFGATWGDTLAIDNIKIIDLLSDNAGITLNVPASVKAGDKATITATVTNKGENAASGYTVVIKAGDKELLNETVEEELGSFETKDFTAELETTIFDKDDIDITATVNLEGDLDDTDDTATATIAIKVSSAAGAENVSAAVGEDGQTVDVTWNAPTTSSEEVTDDVESYDDDTNGGLGEDVHTGTIGDWTVYDGNDGLYGYGFNGVTSALGQPGSWLVFNPLATNSGLANYAAHSGEKYFISACVAVEDETATPPATDNWLISPELSGSAQTITFWTRELVNDYGAEKYEVLASSTDKEIASFSKIADKTTSATEWEEVSVDLPEGSKYFAIRHTSQDVWALLVDDITFTVGGGDIDHYNIYVDGELVDSTEDTNFTLALTEDGEHEIAITVVYTNGQESAPEIATVEITNGIASISVDGTPVDIYSIDGKLVRKQATSLEGLNGLYIVNDKKVIIK